LEADEGEEKPEDEPELLTKDWRSQERAKEIAENNKIAEEFWLNNRRIFGGSHQEESVKEDVSDGSEDEEQPGETDWAEAFAAEKMWNGESWNNEVPTAPLPPKEMTPIRLHKRRTARAGTSALGTSVLSMKGWVGRVEGEPIYLQLDTCADVTLIF
jgi:hypothetical protein